MIANYLHTHLALYAHQAETEYVEKAIEAGLDSWIFRSYTHAIFRRICQQCENEAGSAGDYVDTILKLKDEYKDDIEIHIGLE